MSEENVEIVRRGYELYAAGDLEGVAGLFSANAEIADAGGLGVADTAVVPATGRKAFSATPRRCWNTYGCSATAK
jgi:ketosteroid isomerase-like protein